MEPTTSLPRISREHLSSMLLSPSKPDFAIIDVRDDDHLGGHIHSSTHVPSHTLDYRLPELVRMLADKDMVVFHCALSQQRGPTAALRYLKERKKKLDKGELPVLPHRYSSSSDGEESGTTGGNDTTEEGHLLEEGVVRGKEGGDWEARDDGDGDNVPGEPKGQAVYVLDGGFVMWQEKYGRDEKLTDAFAPDIWVDYY